MSAPCPACGLVPATDGRWCERCGHDLWAANGAPAWLSSATGDRPCLTCGGAVGTDGYCGQCGRRRIRGLDRVALDLGAVAGMTDRGRSHHHNEDAFAIGRHGAGDDTVTVTVVCDGVSASSRADEAAVAATEAGIDALLRALAAGASATAATETAAAAAATAAAATGTSSETNPPGCTYVSAVVAPDAVTIGWIGDSRAYWVGADGVRGLTVDDNLGTQLAALGLPGEPNTPGFHAAALVRWLGADAAETAAHVDSFTPAGPGVVVVCSDGLSRYLPTPDDLAPLPDGQPAAVARALTQRALDAGGQDNIAVVVLPFPPPDTPGEPTP